MDLGVWRGLGTDGYNDEDGDVSNIPRGKSRIVRDVGGKSQEWKPDIRFGGHVSSRICAAEKTTKVSKTFVVFFLKNLFANQGT